MKRRITILTIAVTTASLLGLFLWKIWSPTRIAFVNYQVVELGQIAKANKHKRIKLSALDLDNLKQIRRYDMVLMNGMGLHITGEQRATIQKAADKGLCIVTTMATNPDNEIISADSTTVATIKAYLNGGGLHNYRNMLVYIRRTVDGKSSDTDEPEPPLMKKQQQFYHIDPAHPDEEIDFSSVKDYEDFLKRHNLLHKSSPTIIVTGQMGDPEPLIQRLEETGNVVYPVRNIQKLVQSHQTDSIHPSAVINLAHGRLGDNIVRYLEQQNIPLFAPLNVNRLSTEWETDQMGMNGGFMSQSIVMPEIDGAIRPYALIAHRIGKDGLQQSYTMPERLETFVNTVNKHIALKNKQNHDKRVVIYYYKGPGQNVLTAAGMEVAPSLYNLLCRMKKEGYNVENLPDSYKGLEALIQKQGSVFNAYAKGAKNNFLRNGNPELITPSDYAAWISKAFSPSMMKAVEAVDGEFPGNYISTDDGRLALPRVVFGNIVLIPQLAAGMGDDDFAIVHGTDAAPPHAYIASYLWARYTFHADIMIHFGTHGSLEFTPRKQVALSSKDWPDALVGEIPHLYIYSIGDVGEGIIAKRRSYATLQSYLTPPFMESDVRGIYHDLNLAIQEYNDLLYAEGHPSTLEAALKVKKLTIQLGIHRELRLDSLMTSPYSGQEISKIEAFAEELANEKITGELYTMGKPYSHERVMSSVYAIATEPIAYSLFALDKMRGKATDEVERHKSLFTKRYIKPARNIVSSILSGETQVSDSLICSMAGITIEKLLMSRQMDKASPASQDMMTMMMAMQTSGVMPSTTGMGGKKETKPEFSKEERELARIVTEIERTVNNVNRYRKALYVSPEAELLSILNAMNGGYTSPSPGGDPIANPNTIPTGRNLYAINAEATPSEKAWEQGKQLADNTIKMYRQSHNDSIPRKVSYTLWSGEFVETEGATIAQVLYMLGVEPVRDAFGRVNDLRLIPSSQLGRPRIDVVVQTSGQLRDLASSRLFLISRAVEMAANATNDVFENFVAQGVIDAERTLVAKGLTPKEAREASTYRVFGGVNGNYGTGISEMVQSGDRWEKSSEISDIYLKNMGAFYGSEKEWEKVQQFAFEAALSNTDAVIQPRQSNTWGALSLDHVYEFMGGMNLAVRNVTGKEPDAYMSDYRNHNNMRMQELKEAVGVESRTTIFNPTYIKEKMLGTSSSAAIFAEIIQNTYAWNVMKPDVIDNEMWDEIYNVYVQDKFNLDIREYFEQKNPAALEEMTAVMMETARKGMWNASNEQLETIAQLHTDLVEKHGPSCSGSVCNNTKLRDFIASKTSRQTAERYERNIREIREASLNNDNSVLLKHEQPDNNEKTISVSNSIVAVIAFLSLFALIMTVRSRRKKMEE